MAKKYEVNGITVNFCFRKSQLNVTFLIELFKLFFIIFLQLILSIKFHLNYSNVFPSFWSVSWCSFNSEHPHWTKHRSEKWFSRNSENPNSLTTKPRRSAKTRSRTGLSSKRKILIRKRETEKIWFQHRRTGKIVS